MFVELKYGPCANTPKHFVIIAGFTNFPLRLQAQGGQGHVFYFVTMVMCYNSKASCLYFT